MTTQGARQATWGVATPHPSATAAAADALQAGGSAVDAAIAAAGVLTVAYPHNCSVGGDLIGLVRAAKNPPRAVFGVGRSAGAIDAEAVRRKFGSRLPAEGPLSISVPGVVSGWQAMHRLGGRLRFEALLEPAVRLASEGVPVSPSLGRALADLVTSSPGLDNVFGPPGRRLAAGDLLVQPHLAETLAQVAADPETYYRGELARRLAAGLEAQGSPITVDDFAIHQAIVEEPLLTEAGTLAPRLFTAGLPSQGIFFAGLAEIASQLLAKGYELGGKDAAVLAGAFAEMSSVRDAFLSDPTRSPGRRLISAAIDGIDILSAHRPRSIPAPWPAAAARPSGDTVAIVTSDAEGNSVSLLQSVFHSFGSRVLDPATGVLFHSRQSMFTLRSDDPGALGPGLMPPHTLCPSMADTAEGDPSLVLATMGGRAQPQVLVQVLAQVALGKSAQEAVAAARYVVGALDTPHAGRTVTAERGLPPAVLRSLVGAGFDVREVGGLTEEAGHAQLLRLGTHGVTEVGSDPRADGVAALGG